MWYIVYAACMNAKYWRVFVGIQLAIIIIIIMIIIIIIIVVGNLIRLKYKYVVCIEQNIKLRHLGWLKSSPIYFMRSSHSLLDNFALYFKISW